MKLRIPLAAAFLTLASLGAHATDLIQADTPGELMRVERAFLDAESQTSRDPFSFYTGEEGGWQLTQHAYAFSKGRFVHADQIPHDPKAPAFTVAGERTPAAGAAPEAESRTDLDPFSVYDGEEGGRQLKQHAYAFSNGRLVHADQIPHDTKAPVFTAADAAAPGALYGGS